ncbi:MAG: hypothetical protein JWM80_1280 [Cyanobacteria bacterium RYN_339]|nr:hypothetical protein [Cyanobacteria bacterium RYN_339]
MRQDYGNDNLSAHCTIHDRSQFEVQFNYDVAADNLSDGQAVEHYRVEAYYFFPSNMGISQLSFPRETFYRSLYGYIRFKTPEISELTLLDPLSRQSPLNAISFHVKQIDSGDASAEDKAVNEARLFGCIVSSLLRARAKDLDERMQAAKSRPGDNAAWRELEGALGDFLSDLPELLERYRGLVAEFRTLESRLAPTTLSRLGQVDEFLTYRFDHTLADLHFQLQSTWEAPTRLAKVSDRLHAVAEREGEHRARQGYVSLAPGDDDALALYTYRSGALKKLIDQVLYLDVKTIQETNRWKNFAAMMGALVAAYFAALTNTGFILRLYATNLLLAMTIFAIAYVVKDRIKELLRESLWSKISRYFPDNKLLIHDPTSDIDVGKCKERVIYLTKPSVPADVLKVRNTQHVVDLDQERKETVILYQNDLKLYAREILSEHKRRTDIKHILRFSVEELLARLDNPTARVQFYDPSSRIFCRVRAPKVYHLNVVFRLTHWDERNRKEAPFYHRIRVILDKNGIHRIDTVPLDGEIYTQRKSQGPLPAAVPIGEENLF